MPRRTDLNHVLVIGSGPIVIGQACEFDYSGTQACRVLRAEGLQVSLVNSNPATIMTDPEYADHTYVEPITAAFVEKVIAQQAERGQQDRRAAGDPRRADRAQHRGRPVRERGAREVRRRDDRRRLRGHPARRGPAAVQGHRRQGRRRIGPKSRVCFTMDEVRETVGELGPAGRGPAVVHDGRARLGHGALRRGRRADGRRRAGRIAERQRADRGIDLRLEGIRARADARRHRDNVVVVCSIENFDPMGVHTGDSVTVAPAMTLTDREYQTDARPRHRDPARGRRRHRRLQHPVRGRPRTTAGSSSSR